MRSLPLQRAIGLAIAALAWTACGGTGTPAPATAIQAPAAGFGDDAIVINVSGQYTGKVNDSVHGTGKASGDLAQHRNAVGGVLASTYATQSLSASGAFSLAGTSLHGTAVLSSGSATCVFSETATYDPSTHRLSGSYRSFNKCGGATEKGTFDLRQRCFYARDWAVRYDAGGVKQC